MITHPVLADTLAYLSLSTSCDHLSNKPLAHESLSHGLLVGEPKLR